MVRIAKVPAFACLVADGSVLPIGLERSGETRSPSRIFQLSGGCFGLDFGHD